MPTDINYLDDTWNITFGCEECSPECKNCYARRLASGRFLKDNPLYKGLVKNGKWTGKIRLCTEIGRKDILEQPLHWRKPRKIGVQFMGDLFHPKVPFDFQVEVFDVMSKCYQHKFFVLTKRVDNMCSFLNRYYDDPRYDNAPKNYKHVWIGVSISNQDEDWKIEKLLQIPGKRWISFEPLLEKIDILPYTHIGNQTYYKKEKVVISRRLKWEYRTFDFAVIGCESGPNRRPCPHEWIKSLYDQCKAAGVEVMVKQMSENADGTGKICHEHEICERTMNYGN